MSRWSRTSREVDGETIVGSWRPAFIHNGGTYHLTDLVIWADGFVDCWGLVTLEEFRDKLRTGWVATTFREGARAAAHEVASWTFTDVHSSVDADDLYAEVVDEIEALNGRLDSSDRCLKALRTCLPIRGRLRDDHEATGFVGVVVRRTPLRPPPPPGQSLRGRRSLSPTHRETRPSRYLDDRTEANRERLATAYHAIPKHRRVYVLGDQDAKDWPLRVLITPEGEDLGGELVTAERRSQSAVYLAERFAGLRRTAEPTLPVAPPVVIPGSFHHRGWPDPPGVLGLHTQFPAPVRIGSVTYPTVEHAYWALRTNDRTVREAVLAEPNPYGLFVLAARSAARAGWDAALPAIISQLLRAKFQQHDDLAQELLATGEGRILFQASGFGDVHESSSRSLLIGRLLEVIRAEQHAWRSGLLDLGGLD